MSYLQNVPGVAVLGFGRSGFVLTRIPHAQLRKWFGIFGIEIFDYHIVAPRSLKQVYRKKAVIRAHQSLVNFIR